MDRNGRRSLLEEDKLTIADMVAQSDSERLQKYKK